MFGIDMNEFLLVVLLALVLIGPKQLPEVARGIGKLLVAFRRATSDLRNVVSDEINAHPEYRDLAKLRDEISDDIRGVGDRAKQYMEKELEKEKQMAEAVERDVHSLGSRVQDEITKAADESEDAAAKVEPPPGVASATAVADGAPAGGDTLEIPPDRTEFDKAYRAFYTANEPAPAPSAEAAAPPEAARPETTAAESPEDAHLRERESLSEAVPGDKPGHFLLRSGGRGGGGRGGPYSFSPAPPPKPDPTESKG